MSNKYEQRFFSALKDTFVGHKIKGKSGYVNLLDLKQQYFAQIEPFIKKEIDETIDESSQEELYEKLYSFFDSYLNETGTVFFANSQLHKNLYERVYSDRDDVSLFWKTQKLYYVKSEAMYDDLETVISDITYVFDASDIKHAKGNEKKSLVFYLVDVQSKKLTFKVRYQEQTKYDRLKAYLEIEKPNDIKDHLIANYDNAIHGNVNVLKNNIDRSLFTKKGDLRDCIYCNNENDALNSVTIEFSPSKVEQIHFYCNSKSVICTEEEIKKAFHIYKKQNEVDYFIHKNAESFLKEQFDIYTYNWLFNDLKTEFDAPTVTRFQNIKKIAHKVIEYIAKFENELKAIWEKPKFVRNSNYVLTLDRLFPIKETKANGTIIRDFTNKDSLDLINEIIKHDGFKNQKNEWINLQEEWTDSNGEIVKKIWNDFEKLNKAKDVDFINSKEISNQLWTAPIDTKYFTDIKFKILNKIDFIDNQLIGTVIKTDNWQALNSLKKALKNEVQLTYIDPPFNTGSDFAYKDSYQNSTWLTLMLNRLDSCYDLLRNDGSFYLHLDENANHLGRMLMDYKFGQDKFKREIIWDIQVLSGYKVKGAETNWILGHQSIYFYTKSNKSVFNKLIQPQSLKYLESFNQTDEKGKEFQVAHGRRIYKEDVIARGKPFGDVWNKLKDIIEVERPFPDVWKELVASINYDAPLNNVWSDIMSFQQQPTSSERIQFDTQKPEKLLERIIKSGTNENDLVLDYYAGSGSTASTSIQIKRKFITTEIGEHYDSIVIPRLKRTLNGHQTNVARDNNYLGGGFFQYYELEQYEDVLSKALYQWNHKDKDIEQYSFMQDQKLLESLEVDYESKNVRVMFEKLYPDVDIAETLSNLSGKPIKELAEDYCVLIDKENEEELKIVYNEMTFEKYPWIKPLIWWYSK